MGFVESEHRPSHGVGAAVIVAAVLALVIVFLLVVALMGAIFYARARAAQQQAIAERQRAIAEAMRARLVFEAEHDVTDSERVKQDVLMGLEKLAGMEAEPEERPGLVVEVRMDAEGRLTFEQQPVSAEELAAKLQNLPGRSARAFAILLRIDEQCPMEPLSETLRICRRLRIGDIRIRAEKPAADGEEENLAE